MVGLRLLVLLVMFLLMLAMLDMLCHFSFCFLHSSSGPLSMQILVMRFTDCLSREDTRLLEGMLVVMEV